MEIGQPAESHFAEEMRAALAPVPRHARGFS
jgi:hypothetical protein